MTFVIAELLDVHGFLSWPHRDADLGEQVWAPPAVVDENERKQSADLV